MKRKIIFFIILIIATAIFVVACSPVSDNDNEFYVYLTLDGGRGVTASQFISEKTLVKPKAVPTKEGYDFGGWFADKSLTRELIFDVPMTSDVYVYAAWIKKGEEATFVIGGGERDILVKVQGGMITPPDVSDLRKGYEFVGWFSDAALKEKASFDKETENTLFYAGWEIIEYEINYDCGGLADLPTGTKSVYTVEDSVVLQNPIRIASGYEFLGWRKDGEAIASLPKGSVGNVTLVAEFLSGNSKIVNAVGGRIEGNEISVGVKYSQKKVVFADILTPSDRARFAVYTEGEEGEIEIEEADLPDGVSEFKVKVWAENNGKPSEYVLKVTRYEYVQKTVTFVYEDSQTRTESVFKGGLATEPEEIIEVHGYKFVGWYKDAAKTLPYDFSTETVIEDIFLYSKYSPLNYNIRYHVRAGMWNVAQLAASYNIEEEVELGSPTAIYDTRYRFEGWYLEDGSKKFSISAGNTGDIDLYAKYSVDKVSVMDSGAYDYLTGDEIYDTEVFQWLNWCEFNRLNPSVTIYSEHVEGADVEYIRSYLDGLISVFVNNTFLAVTAPAFQIYNFESNAKEVYGVSYDAYTVKFEDVAPRPELSAADSDRYKQLKYTMHGFTSSREEDYEGFEINKVTNTVEVSDSDALYYAVMNGYRPIAKSSTKDVYDAAKAVLRNIVDDGMSDVEKAHAIYDWLILNVAYDYDLLDWSEENGNTVTAESRRYKGFALEGVFFDGRAVCDGLSKAFALMCNIEGIECVQVSGTKGGVGHAWNKFRVDGKWYNADPTSGGLLLQVNAADDTVYSAEGLTHRFFMLTDEEMGETNIPSPYAVGCAEKTANTKYDFYAEHTFKYNGADYDYTVESVEELTVIATYVKQLLGEEKEGIVVDFKLTYSDNEEKVILDVTKAFGTDGYNVAVFDNSNDIMVWLMPEEESAQKSQEEAAV